MSFDHHDSHFVRDPESIFGPIREVDPLLHDRFAELLPEFRVDPARPPTWKPRGDVRSPASLHLAAAA